MKKERYDISGMSCSACSARVEQAVSKLEGIDNCQVNLLTNSMQLVYDEDKISSAEIVTAVSDAGYAASLHIAKGKSDNKNSAASGIDKVDEELESMRSRLIVSMVFMLILMYISMGPMIHLPFTDIFMEHEYMLPYAFTQFLLTLPIMYVNRKYFINGFKALYKKAANMDSLVAVGSSAALIYGIISIYSMSYALGIDDHDSLHKIAMDLYFESAAMILALITLGKYFEAKSKKKTTQAISKLMDLAPKVTRVLRDGVEVEIPTEDVIVGDEVVVKPGEAIPVDGILTDGRTSVDEASITGESIPVEKQLGDKLVAATINTYGRIVMKASHVGEDTTISKIISLVEEASSSKAEVSKLADKVSGIFAYVVMTIALICFVIWHFILGYDISFALSLAIAVLVISCPCALGLATPVAIMVGTGVGAQKGILIKSAVALEQTQSIDTIVLDKTGTVTEGKPSVSDVIIYDAVDEVELLKKAYAIESLSEHPLAKAVCTYAKGKNIELVKLSDFENVSGLGVRAKFAESNLIAGNAKFIKEYLEPTVYEKLIIKGEEIAKQAQTPLYFIEDHRLLGIIAVADSLKADSKQAIEKLMKRGIRVILLTGDHKASAKAIADELEIKEFIAEVLPQDKEATIRSLMDEGRKVAMVGDGINDAPSLARADVGIAIGAGTDIAMDSADVVLMHSSLKDVVNLIDLSRATLRIIRQNLFWAFFYNAICIPLAAGAFYLSFGIKLSPMVAAAAMSMSSVCVVLNALRLRTTKFDKDYKVNETKELKVKENKEMITDLAVNGMMCAHCKASVEKAVKAVENVTAVSANVGEKLVSVTHSSEADIEKIKQAIIDAGYEIM